MGGNGTHDVGMMEALEDLHFVLHPLLVLLDLLFRNGLQRDIAHDVGRLGGVIMRGRVGGGRGDREAPTSCFASSSKSLREPLMIRSITADYKEHFGILLCESLSPTLVLWRTYEDDESKFFKTRLDSMCERSKYSHALLSSSFFQLPFHHHILSNHGPGKGKGWRRMQSRGRSHTPDTVRVPHSSMASSSHSAF